jgi:membrane protease YdiL (CAAX protease family)
VREFLQLLFDPSSEQVLSGLVPWLVLTALGGTLALGGWFLLGRLGVQLPPRRKRAVPWNGWGVLGVLLFAHMIVPALLIVLLVRTGFLGLLYGSEIVLQPKAPDTDSAQQLANARVNVWIMVVGTPLSVAATFYLLYQWFHARPYQLGWTWRRAGTSALLATLAWLAFTPLVYVLNVLATALYQGWLGGPPQPHELAQLARGEPPVIDWVMLVLSAVVMAPLMEELLFRGLMLPWAADEPRNPEFLAAGALLAAVWQGGALKNSQPHTWSELSVELQPAVFVVLVFGAYLGLRRRLPPSAGAICSTSLLWAAFHSSVWPSPVPLFLLGLVLGWLAYRTQSLVAPIVMHSLFNAVACMSLLLGHEAPPPSNGNAATSQARPAPSPSMRSLVPGSWLPRRM